MFWDARIRCEQMWLKYFDDILEQAANWKIQYLSKEKTKNWIEVVTTFWWPTARLVVEEEKVKFYFSYQPFEYKRLIEDKEAVEKIKQAI